MQVEKAVKTRFSCRAFLPDPVPAETVRDILSTARQAASGGNLQPWHVYALAGDRLAALKSDVLGQIAAGRQSEEPAYQIYPDNLKSPYRERRFKCGADLYDSLAIKRSDKAARKAQFVRNFDMFGAPVGLFFYLDKQMLAPQWCDLGIFLQTVMLLACERGLDSCAQESWSMWPQTVARHTGPQPDLMLFCGMALGHGDMTAPVNQWRTTRAAMEENMHMSGF